MGYKIGEVISFLEKLAPPAYQESYDNATLITGNRNWDLTGIICSLDCAEEVIQEAISAGANMVVAHHPIVFKGLKSLTGKNYVERTIIKAIKHDIAIYAIHTNLDHVAHGVNKRISDKLGLLNTKILQPKKQLLNKLVFFVPEEHKNKVLDAVYEAGAGQIGEYKDCSFQVKGMGTFTPSEDANPFLGQRGAPQYEAEIRAEVILPAFLSNKIISAMKKAHPYEEVAYYLSALENENQEVGAGMFGELENPMTAEEFLDYLKEKMKLKIVKHTALVKEKIKKVAVCGGAGIFLLGDAKRKGADVFITADVKYHEFFDADGSLILCDIGHYESEIFTKELLGELLSQNFPNIALYLTKVVTNPTSYR
ncbi:MULTISPECIES: Nif3-like dinuclear metal center hexameric protein [unclassified Algoriphagus]|jgi:dinuclear metal center YbgI/SA1388 family protein|uniref:Nif3-like dinuclear metal center hexameric protein n=2 Tax=Algoriphagus TaxID=246875 RepID=UPI000E931349|nr:MULTISPECIES: Nif3-like dinuclear metal center hexameric protein [unclassified Algoriphagus]QYH38081.1 Nif3-like dinuclear metal center hexameric protein [Algoriphagus sp. NBT04N3]HAD52342.1 Nif3-like dinuclear metal center hexameric protein [Algoriphagus sp.]HAS59107.1 Nif3-like dinuclear metal center hexameric protein [Algoriphagus sp.]HCB45093.1 Nif3-like dinuclear metal center hexameric protein [Algoriphagus sp.]HCH42822.1 Nif3-like dinuclear metal center hexameric protein [Algoriphagus|tara:strand:+ start:539 stop:1639 length:1101 start_codon:yes stop_codon:yes gene_type:complete